MWFMLPLIRERVRGALLMRPQRVAELLLGNFTFRTEGANMKLVTICAVGAILCGPSFCHAQVKFFDSVAEVRSILVASDDTSLQPATAAAAERESDPDFANAEITVDSKENPFSNRTLAEDVNSDDQVATETDPNSLPVGIHHRRNVVDQILQQGLVSQTPNAAFAPVAWPGSQQNNNPTAQSLLYTRCGVRLWDNYAAEQAAECARIQANLTSHAHGCATCPSVGCAHGNCASGNCAPAGPLHSRFNRYTSQFADAPVSCVNPTMATGQGCATCQGATPGYSQAIPAAHPSHNMGPTPAPSLVPAPIGATQQAYPQTVGFNGSLGNVARLPTVAR